MSDNKNSKHVEDSVLHFKYFREKTGHAFTCQYKDGEQFVINDIDIDLTPVMEYIKKNKIKIVKCLK